MVSCPMLWHAKQHITPYHVPQHTEPKNRKLGSSSNGSTDQTWPNPCQDFWGSTIVAHARVGFMLVVITHISHFELPDI